MLYLNRKWKDWMIMLLLLTGITSCIKDPVPALSTENTDVSYLNISTKGITTDPSVTGEALEEFVKTLRLIIYKNGEQSPFFNKEVDLSKLKPEGDYINIPLDEEKIHIGTSLTVYAIANEDSEEGLEKFLTSFTTASDLEQKLIDSPQEGLYAAPTSDQPFLMTAKEAIIVRHEEQTIIIDLKRVMAKVEVQFQVLGGGPSPAQYTLQADKPEKFGLLMEYNSTTASTYFNLSSLISYVPEGTKLTSITANDKSGEIEGAEGSDVILKRNDHVVLEVTIAGDPKKLQINAKVADWLTKPLNPGYN